jgi:large repetitive protein
MKMDVRLLRLPLSIANPVLLTASASASAQVSCNDASDGVLTVTAAGGTGSLSYSLNGGAFQSSNVFSGLASGSYSVEVKDANGCSITTTSVSIANPALLTASASASAQVSCNMMPAMVFSQ